MDLGGAGLAQHGDHGPAGGAPHDGVVEHDQALPVDVVAQRVELQPHAEGPHVLVGGDERAADVAVLDQALAVGDAAAPGVALRRGDARLGHAHDQVGLDRGLLGQLLAHPDPGPVHALAVQEGVGSGEVDELEQAELGVDLVLGEQPHRPVAAGVDDDHLAGVELAHEVGADHVEGRVLRGEHPPVVELAQAQRPEAVRVAHAHDVALVHQHEREGALERGHDLDEGPFEGPTVGAGLGVAAELGGDELRHQVAVAGDRAGQHAGPGGQLLGVGEVAVVAEGEGVGGGVAIDGLGVAPVARPGGGVPGVADGQVAGERGQGAVVEHVGDEAHVLDHGDRLAVAHGHAGRLLAPVLQGVQAEVGQVRDRLSRGVDPEHAAGFLGGVVVEQAEKVVVAPRCRCFAGLTGRVDAVPAGGVRRRQRVRRGHTDAV